MKCFRGTSVRGTLTQLAVTAGLLALCGLPAAVRAQDPPPGAMQSQNPNGSMHRAHGQDDELAKLNLTDDQKAQVKKIREDSKTQMDALKSDTTLTPDQRQAKAKEIHKSSHEQIVQLLTPEQRKQMRSDEMARKAAKQQGEAPPPQQ
jgi:periplasmic protein CpxP/Spy